METINKAPLHMNPTHSLPFRQIHLDFHTSEHIPDIGSAFQKEEYQQKLLQAKVNSITTFATCHHGWAYYNTKVGQRHPGLSFDLLRAQMDACKEIGIRVPVYLTAGVNNLAASEHPEWRQLGPDGCLTGWAKSNLEAGFFYMCFQTAYLKYLCSQIREVVALFPENDGIFLDIIHQPECVCHACMASMQDAGLDPAQAKDRQKHVTLLMERYYRATTDAAKHLNPETPVFHNSGHISPGVRSIFPYFSHVELESLPTGGWGYDHFPISAKYCMNLPFEFSGMTGKFHTTWGEFGGLKHPNALRYECAQMLAVGARCSVGDQLHPQGKLDESTYEVIGRAYAEVEAKEPWCIGALPLADIGVLSSAAVNRSTGRDNAADIGAGRVLLEGQFQFSVLDTEMDFSPYKALLLPDDVRVDQALKEKIDRYIEQGGRVILSGSSGLKPDGQGFWWDFGVTEHGVSPFQPDYLLPAERVRPEFVQTPVVMYLPSRRIRVEDGMSLGKIHDPFFNRSYAHFSSHQHAPNRSEASGYDGGVIRGNFLYFAHPVFSIYRAYGAVVYRQYITAALREFLGGALTVESNLPSTARLHMTEQAEPARIIVHLLYAQAVLRGGPTDLHGGNAHHTQSIEVIEDLLPLVDVKITLRLPKPVHRVTLEPQGEEIRFSQTGGAVHLTLDRFICHQMLVLHTETAATDPERPKFQNMNDSL